jgi:hypothetical protein
MPNGGNNLTLLNQYISNAEQELQSAEINESIALQNLQNFEMGRLLLDNSFNQLSPLFVNKLAKEITNKTQDLAVQIDLPNDQQEQWIETNLQKYIQQKESNITGSLTALPALMRYIFLLAPLLSSLSAFRMYLIAAGSAVMAQLRSMLSKICD